MVLLEASAENCLSLFVFWGFQHSPSKHLEEHLPCYLPTKKEKKNMFSILDALDLSC